MQTKSYGEMGFNHFLHAAGADHGGDIVFHQPHSALGVYARTLLDGRLSEYQLKRYYRKIGGPGLRAYPHPWLMPDFRQVPLGSASLRSLPGAFTCYLRGHSILDTDGRLVRGVFGDGEMDEPGSFPLLSYFSFKCLILLYKIIISDWDAVIEASKILSH